MLGDAWKGAKQNVEDHSQHEWNVGLTGSAQRFPLQQPVTMMYSVLGVPKIVTGTALQTPIATSGKVADAPPEQVAESRVRVPEAEPSELHEPSTETGTGMRGPV